MPGFISGALAGLAYGLVGYCKKTKVKGFNWTRLLTTVVIACGAGGVANYMNSDIGTVNTMLISGGADVLLENLWKLLYRRLR